MREAILGIALDCPDPNRTIMWFSDTHTHIHTQLSVTSVRLRIVVLIPLFEMLIRAEFSVSGAVHVKTYHTFGIAKVYQIRTHTPTAQTNNKLLKAYFHAPVIQKAFKQIYPQPRPRHTTQTLAIFLSIHYKAAGLPHPTPWHTVVNSTG